MPAKVACDESEAVGPTWHDLRQAYRHEEVRIDWLSRTFKPFDQSNEGNIMRLKSGILKADLNDCPTAPP